MYTLDQIYPSFHSESKFAGWPVSTPPPIAPQQPTLSNNVVSVSVQRPHGYPAPVLPSTAPQKPAAFNGQLLGEAWPAKQMVPKDHPREKASAKKAGASSAKSRSLAG